MSDSPFKSKKMITYGQAHEDADTDNDRSSIHHTLGAGPNMAAPGNHKHETVLAWNPGPITDDIGNLLASTIEYSWATRIGGLIFFGMNITSNATQATCLQFQLPASAVGSGGAVVCTGREMNATGNTVKGVVAPPGTSRCQLFTYNNGATAVNGHKFGIMGMMKAV